MSDIERFNDKSNDIIDYIYRNKILPQNLEKQETIPEFKKNLSKVWDFITAHGRVPVKKQGFIVCFYKTKETKLAEWVDNFYNYVTYKRDYNDCGESLNREFYREMALLLSGERLS